MHTSPNILEVEHLTYRIGKSVIVDDFGLHVRTGEILGLIGPNGAGKTTVLDLISGFTIPERGEISFGGTQITRMAPYRRVRCGLCRTFQESPAIPGLTAYEHVLLAHRNRSKRASPLPSTLPVQLIGSFGLSEFRDHAAASLSSSHRRLLDLCRAIATAPHLLLLDEPFAGLTTAERANVLHHIRECKANGCAVLIVEHRLPILDQVADRILVMVAGRTIADGQMDEVLKNPAVQRAYLGRSPMTLSKGDAP